VPVSVGGRSIGVLHAAAAEGEPPTSSQVRRFEAIATQTGSRIGMLRVMAATTLQAATDPLTGLLNRRAFENRVHALVRANEPFALAMGDLDHFKRLNDTHGHDAGDRALRLFARVLQRSLRAEDVVSRYGGEEFVVVFPDRTATQAAAALERMQEQLVVALTEGSVPGFTVSYGITDSTQSRELDELCRIADAALFRAKREGRNRVVTDTSVAAADVAPGQLSDAKSATDQTRSVSSEMSSTVRTS
jgi:diguanylate cyclase (GGDEF)-like protein